MTSASRQVVDNRPVNVRWTTSTSMRLAAAWTVFLVVGLGVGYVVDTHWFPVWSLLRDPGHLLVDFHPNTGVLSIIGCMMWWLAGGLLVLAGWVRRSAGWTDPIAKASIAFGAFALAWGLDDAAMLHDWWLEEVLHVPDVLAFGIMFVIAGVIGYRHRDVVIQTDLTLLVLAMFGFAVSITFDLPSWNEAVEELAKLWSILVVLVWSAKTARDVLLATVRSGPADTLVPARTDPSLVA